MWNHDTLSAKADTNLYSSHPFILEVRTGSPLLSVHSPQVMCCLCRHNTQCLGCSCIQASASICHCCMHHGALFEGLQCSNNVILTYVFCHQHKIASNGKEGSSLLECSLHACFILFLSCLMHVQRLCRIITQHTASQMCLWFKQLPHTVSSRVFCMLQMEAATASCCSIAMPWKL